MRVRVTPPRVLILRDYHQDAELDDDRSGA
jgi:hypothetical protein